MQILSYLHAPTSVLPCFHASAVKWDWGYCRKGESFLPQADSELCPYFLGIAFWTLRRVANGEDKELLCPWSFIHSVILFNHHIRASATYETKMHETWILASRTPNSEGNQIIGCALLYYYRFLTAPFSVSVFQIPSYLVTDLKWLVHSGSVMLAYFFSFDVHANCWI